MTSVSYKPIVPFAQFIQSLHAARAEHYLNVPHSAIDHEDSFHEMQAHLTNYYSLANYDSDISINFLTLSINTLALERCLDLN
jgi:hypothetical protein